MMAYVLTARDRSSARALPGALQALTQLDPGLRLHTDELGHLLLAGRDDAHLSLAVRRLEDLWGARVDTALPHVKYIETPAADVTDVAGVHVLEDSHGLVEEYGACRLDLSPCSPDQGWRFVDGVSDDEALPARWRPAIERGAQQALAHGPTAGYPVVGADVCLRGGEYDLLQSTDDHFEAAGRIAVQNALVRAGTRLLEPWWSLRVRVPAEAVGDVLSDISSHRGRILGVDGVETGVWSNIDALCPHRELRTFAARLQRLSGGRGTFSTSPSHYEALPLHLVSEAVASSPFRADERRQPESRAADPRRGGIA
jgi:elongation factor G